MAGRGLRCPVGPLRPCRGRGGGILTTDLQSIIHAADAALAALDYDGLRFHACAYPLRVCDARIEGCSEHLFFDGLTEEDLAWCPCCGEELRLDEIRREEPTETMLRLAISVAVVKRTRQGERYERVREMLAQAFAEV